MRLRRLFVLSAVLMAVSAAYIASPFVSASNLRDAIKRGDSAAIEGRVDWPAVRETLRTSLAREAKLLPLANEAGATVRPTLWQRIKGAFGASMLDRFIETYVTPEGLPKLMDYRKTWSASVATAPAEPEPASKVERFRQFWARIKRAEFQSLTQVEIEVADKTDPARRFVSRLKLDGLGWKLTALSIKTVDPANRVADLERSGAEVR